MFSKTLYVALALVATFTPKALATIFVTEPVSSTVCSAGVTCVINWDDDGTSPTLAEIGDCSIGVYVGSSQTQTLLQLITSSLDVATASTVSYVPDGSMGPNDDVYFIKFISLGLMDPSDPTYPYEEFSAKFTLNNMTGTFNSTILSEIAAGTVSASTPAATSAAASTPASVPASTTNKAATSTSAKSTASATSTAKSSGAWSTKSGALSAGVLGGVAGILGYVFA